MSPLPMGEEPDQGPAHRSIGR